MVTLLRQGGGSVYDGVSASGDASNRLIANGDVAAIDPAQIPGFGDIAPFLQNAPHYVVGGQVTTACPTAGAATASCTARIS